MTDISVGLGTLANLTTAMESIGWSADTTDNTKFYWDNDTDKLFYLQFVTSGTNLIPKLYYANGTVTANNSNITISTTANQKISYELLEGGGIALGFTPTTSAFSRIHFIIAAPISQTDHWMLIPYNSNYLCDANTASNMTYNYTKQISSDLQVIQIVRAYNGINFCDNVCYTSLCKNIPDYTNDNTLRATIGGNLYLLVNLTGANTYASWAVRIAS